MISLAGISAFGRHFFENLLSPFFMVVCVFIFLMLKGIKNQPKTYRMLAYSCIVLLGILTTPWVPKMLVQRFEFYYKPIKTIQPDIQWVVVLGGGTQKKAIYAHEALTSSSLKRALTGIMLLKQLPDAKLLMSGGNVNQNEVTVAEMMGRFAQDMGISQSSIILEPYSINTEDEAQEIKKIVGKAPFYLVTSALHMRRSVILLTAQGLTPIPAPCDYIGYWKGEPWVKQVFPNPENMKHFLSAWHEVLGILWSYKSPSKYFSASNAAMQPNPAEVIA